MLTYSSCVTHAQTEGVSHLLALAASVERAPERLHSSHTGSQRLDDLVDWWSALSPTGVLRYRAITHPEVSRVEAAIDGGVTLVSFVAEPTTDDAALRSVIGLYSGHEISELLPRDRSDLQWMADAQKLRDDLFNLRDVRAEPAVVVHTLNIPQLTERVEALLTCAARQTPCLLESLPDFAAALIADRLTHRAKGWWLACGTSRDGAVTAARERLALEPALDLVLESYSTVGATVIAEMLTILTDKD